jgi:uncharacterized membrane protein YeaQ/YmgE (transglycosylase-associated protein family)
VLGLVISVMVIGFITGALARLAVPGPDPMPAWLTIAIGLAGTFGGGAIGYAIFGRNAYGVNTIGFICAILLVIAYRRFYQQRPVTGPEAFKFPERGIGIDRFRARRERARHSLRRAQHAQAAADVEAVNDQIRKLADLHDAGVITDDEFEAKKRELLSGL